MKKFISALSSFVIAATAMGGTMAVSTDAAVNGSVSETIVAMRSNGKDTVNVKAGDTVPVEIYIPQSSGFNTLLLKFGIGKNGDLDDTKGQGYVLDRNGKKIENYKDAFGNYGIEMVAKGDAIDGTATDFSYPNCLETGATSQFSLDAGDICNTGIAMFNSEAWSILYQAQPEIKAGKNVDAFGAWVAAGGKLEEDFNYGGFTPATTWTKDEKWAYDYTFTKVELKLPADMPDGTYVFDVYKDVYINTHPASLFRDDNSPIPDDERGDAQSNFSGVDGKQKYSTEKLTIVVGDPSNTDTPPVTTTAPITTQDPGSSENPGSQSDGSAIIYNLVPSGKEYTKATTATGNNTYKATAGEDLKIDWTIQNDLGTAGIQMNFDFTQVEYVSGARGTGYRINPTYSDFESSDNLKKGECVYTWAQSSEASKAKDDSVIYSFNVKVPSTNGTYKVGLNTKELNKVIPVDETKPHKFEFHGLDIVVGDPTPGSETTPGSSDPGSVVTPDANTIVYNLVPSGKEYESAEEKGTKNNVYNATAGEDLKIDWTIKNDLGTAGIQMNFDFTQVEYVSGARGTGYRINPTYSDFESSDNLKKGECVYTWAQSSEASKAKDGSVIFSFNVKVPADKGTYSVGLNTKELNKVIPVDETKPHKFAFYGLDIVVGAPVTTPGTTTTTPGSQDTTTTPVSQDTTTTPVSQDTTTTPVSSETTPVQPSVLYGDVNCDGDVRINDVVLLNKYLAKNAKVSAQGLLNADCEKDDKVDAKDATKIKQFLALLIERSELGQKSK